MYWWNVSKLAEDLREGRVKEMDRFKYYLAMLLSWTLAWTLVTMPFFSYSRTFHIADLIGAVTSIAVVSIGTILCYWANRNGDDTDFVGRMICLAWPIGIRLLVLVAVLGLAFYGIVSLTACVGWAMGFSWDQTEEVMYLEKEAWSLALGILYYWLLYKHVKIVAQPKEAT